MASFSNVKALFDIKGRNYIVTGGAQGIGFAIVHALAQLGANVVALDVKQTPSVDYESIAREFHVGLSYIQADVTDEVGLTKAFERAFEILGTVHGLVTCAGIALEKAFEETTWQECRRLQDINVRGYHLMCPYNSGSSYYQVLIIYVGYRHVRFRSDRSKTVQEAGNWWEYRPHRFHHFPHGTSTASYVCL
jgi:hypothetical protein